MKLENIIYAPQKESKSSQSSSNRIQEPLSDMREGVSSFSLTGQPNLPHDQENRNSQTDSLFKLV